MQYRFTGKMQKHIDVLQNIESAPIYPYQLFSNLLYEPTGVCPEVLIHLIQHLGKEKVYYFKESGHSLCNNEAANEEGGMKWSESMVEVMEEADKRRKRYNQLLINEGHLFHAMLTKDPILAKLIPASLREEIRSFTSVARNMTVNLRHYQAPKIMLEDGITIMRASIEEKEEVETYISQEFGEPWVETIRISFEQQTKPLFLARDGHELIGFACYDSVRHQKGVYGPMGTSPHSRLRGVGAALLHTCLAEMKQIGYEFAILVEAGPIEYYEKACDAQLIPIKNY